MHFGMRATRLNMKAFTNDLYKEISNYKELENSPMDTIIERLENDAEHYKIPDVFNKYYDNRPLQEFNVEKLVKKFEKNKVEKLMAIVQQFSDIYGPEAVQEKAPFDMLWNMTTVAFGIWDNTEIAKSKKQATKDKNMQTIQKMMARYNAMSGQEATTLPPIEPNAGIPTSDNKGTWALQAWSWAAFEPATWGARLAQ